MYYRVVVLRGQPESNRRRYAAEVDRIADATLANTVEVFRLLDDLLTNAAQQRTASGEWDIAIWCGDTVWRA